MLRLLWVGIAVLLDRHPLIRHLFGPVSISPQFSDVARFLIMTALQRHHLDAELKALVRSRNALPPTNPQAAQRLLDISAGLSATARLSRFWQCLERGLKLLMLIKHYIELRGRFASFSVDDNFTSTLDGLVFVRVQDIQPKMRARLARPAAHATSQNLG